MYSLFDVIKLSLEFQSFNYLLIPTPVTMQSVTPLFQDSFGEAEGVMIV